MSRGQAGFAAKDQSNFAAYDKSKKLVPPYPLDESRRSCIMTYRNIDASDKE
jgi:hypothetical protein